MEKKMYIATIGQDKIVKAVTVWSAHPSDEMLPLLPGEMNIDVTGTPCGVGWLHDEYLQEFLPQTAEIEI